MPFISTIPNANDNISTSQGQLRGNNLFLGDTIGTNNPAPGEGFYRLPNGLIIQWGKFVNPPDAQVIPFPIAFSNACHNVQLTIVKDSGSAKDFVYVKSLATVTVAQFVVRVIGDNLPYTLYWFAIGV